jgi:hypothetical protein
VTISNSSLYGVYTALQLVKKWAALLFNILKPFKL